MHSSPRAGLPRVGPAPWPRPITLPAPSSHARPPGTLLLRTPLLTAVQADVGGALALHGSELAAEAGRRGLLGQPLDIHAAVLACGRGARAATHGTGFSALQPPPFSSSRQTRRRLCTCAMRAPARKPRRLKCRPPSCPPPFSPLTTTKATGDGAEASAERVKPSLSAGHSSSLQHRRSVRGPGGSAGQAQRVFGGLAKCNNFVEFAEIPSTLIQGRSAGSS